MPERGSSSRSAGTITSAKMNESIPSRAQPAHAAQNPRTWFFVRGVFAVTGGRRSARRAVEQQVVGRQRQELLEGLRRRHPVEEGGGFAEAAGVEAARAERPGQAVHFLAEHAPEALDRERPAVVERGAVVDPLP